MFSKKFCGNLYFLVTSYYDFMKLLPALTFGIVTTLFFKLLCSYYDS